MRARIKAAQAELATLRAVPIASPEIRRRVEQYVHSLPVPMMLAFFHRDAMVETLMREIDNVTDDILPLAERNKRIAELEVEIDAQTAPSLRPRRGHR